MPLPAGEADAPRSTLIIIVLILVACVVACGEITARIVLHTREGRKRTAQALAALYVQ